MSIHPLLLDDQEVTEMWDCIAAYRDVTSITEPAEPWAKPSPAFETGFQKLSRLKAECQPE